MPLYVVSFAEAGGYRCQCRIRAAAVADHITLAVQKIWGATCYWTWEAGSETDGRVYEQVGDAQAPTDIPRTAPCAVAITPAHRRPRVA
jgi:hypothetical protein